MDRPDFENHTGRRLSLNPKFEARNPKQIQKFKIQMIETFSPDLDPVPAAIKASRVEGLVKPVLLQHPPDRQPCFEFCILVI